MADMLEVVAAHAARGRRSVQTGERVTDQDLPAWSEPFTPEARARLARRTPALRASTANGRGAARRAPASRSPSSTAASRAAIRSSRGRLVESVAVEIVDDEATVVPDEPVDLYGHATACAGIIVGLAPEVEMYSVRVLGADLRGKGAAFLAGLEWAVEQGVRR